MTKWIITGVIATLALIGLGMTGCPMYNVWQQGLAGEAELQRAKQNRQITIEEAEADNIAATSRAKAKIKIATAEGMAMIERAKGASQAEVVRADGVSKANVIIGKSLKDNEAYLRYLWIIGLQDGSSEVIYIPTEANLPILEATRKLQK